MSFLNQGPPQRIPFVYVSHPPHPLPPPRRFGGSPCKERGLLRQGTSWESAYALTKGQIARSETLNFPISLKSSVTICARARILLFVPTCTRAHILLFMPTYLIPINNIYSCPHVQGHVSFYSCPHVQEHVSFYSCQHVHGHMSFYSCAGCWARPKAVFASWHLETCPKQVLAKVYFLLPHARGTAGGFSVWGQGWLRYAAGAMGSVPSGSVNTGLAATHSWHRHVGGSRGSRRCF
jgi:hypothetical protein